MMPSVVDIMRYPVKGLNGQRLEETTLVTGGPIACDRAFAIAHGRTEFDPENPVYMSKTRFLALMTHERLAELTTRFDAAGTGLTLAKDGKELLQADLGTEAGRKAADAFFNSFIGDQSKGAPRVVSAEGHMFSDVPEQCLSVLNLASVRALGEHLGQAIDPLRFRANIHVEGLDPWAERDWQEDMVIRIGSAELKVQKQIVRCAATNVNLETAERDLNLPLTLKKEFGGNLMGVYAGVAKGGTIACGDDLIVESA
jgi:uncharacterized protein YcbX